MRVILIIFICMSLSSCAVLRDVRENEAVDNIGSFRLSPVHTNNYWYDGTSYEYNEYEIKITAGPCEARVEWAGKTIGTTPFTYRFTGILYMDEYVRVRAIPISGEFPAQEAMMRIRTELPREIHFKLNNKKEGNSDGTPF